MIALVIVVLLALVCIGALILPEDKLLRSGRIYIASSWIPLGIALLPILLPGVMEKTLGYFLIFVLLIASVSSLLFFVLGIRLLRGVKQNEQGRVGMVIATGIAAIPFVLIVLYVIIHRATLSTRG